MNRLQRILENVAAQLEDDLKSGEIDEEDRRSIVRYRQRMQVRGTDAKHAVERALLVIMRKRFPGTDWTSYSAQIWTRSSADIFITRCRKRIIILHILSAPPSHTAT
jgi:hypothetical protein